ncbi:hypothetical protein [Streptomyces sp. NPDC050485]|uniref:hypothetical protein n=1 Tax=Streptomyces sp. NPDC050485 TaxID=3365617 RepID=UPI0037AD8767
MRTLLDDKGYDSNLNRDELRKRRILPVISRKGTPDIKGMGKLRYVVEQTLALLHRFKRLAVRHTSVLIGASRGPVGQSACPR